MSIFSKIQKTKVRKNTFDLTHDKKMTFRMGQLIPFFLMDLVPGDNVKVKTAIMTRFAPLVYPVMHRVSVYCHFFFVPNRILWPNWENFITGGEDGMDASVWPYFEFDVNTAQKNTVSDYIGLPVNGDQVGTPGTVNVSALPHAVYAKIWDQYYRDQNLQGEISVSGGLADGDNTATVAIYDEIKERAWQHDYFTSALPWTQKGPEAMLPLGTRAEIELDTNYPFSTGQQNILKNDGTPQPSAIDLWSDSNGKLTNSTFVTKYLDLNNTHYADLSTATASSINDLRRAFRLQEWLEKNARGGSRYIESIAVHFGVQSSDKRLQRPEYLGGYSAPVKISEVLQTSETQTTPLGNFAGHGISFGSGGNIGFFAEEHGYLMGIMSIMPMTAYQQGIPRHMSRSDKFDYYWPEFAHIGEQPVVNKELLLSDTPDYNEGTFGYNPRYSEYKYMNNSVHGDMRDSLDKFHLGRKFSSDAALNADFIQCDNTETERVFAAAGSADQLWCHVLNEVKARRPMPVFGTPKF